MPERFEPVEHDGYPAIFDHEQNKVAGFITAERRDEALDMMRDDPEASDLWAWTKLAGGQQ